MKYYLFIIIVFLLNSCSIKSLFDQRSESESNEKIDSRPIFQEIEGMSYIPGGDFKMGSNQRPNEKPVRRVTISSFYLDNTEVTVADFRRFAKSTRRKMPKQPDWNMDTHPVVNVTWNDANAYAKWAGKRLPTEAEWEYVARGGNANYRYVYENSQTYGKNYENIADESMRRYKYHFPVVSGYDDGYVFTAPVGLFAPNKFGIHDLNGNVLEWCADWYSDGYKVNETKDPVGPSKGNYKVIRGASWNRSGNYMQASYRTFYNTKVQFDFLGFRCAKDIELPISQNMENQKN